MAGGQRQVGTLLMPISLKREFGKSLSDARINKYNLEIAHCVLARDYKGLGNDSNGVLVYD